VGLLTGMDRQAQTLGNIRQALIKMRIVEWLE